MPVEEEDPRKAGTQNRVSRIEYRDMFTVSVETHFRASHQLPLPAEGGYDQDRRCRPDSKEPEHYHNWSVTADVSSNKLNSRGVVIDFHRLKAAVDNIVAEFDNTALDRTEYFQQNNPSAENVAKYIYEKLEPKLPKGVKLQSIRVVEGPAHRRRVGSKLPVAACSAKFARDRDPIRETT